MNQESSNIRGKRHRNIVKLQQWIERKAQIQAQEGIGESSRCDLLMPEQSPCHDCEKACWSVVYLKDKERVNSKNEKVKIMGDYELRCFCLVQHCFIEAFPLLCDGNPEFYPEYLTS